MSTYTVNTLKARYVKHPETTGTLDIETVSFKNGLVTMPEAGNIAAGTTTGTKIGTAVTQKLGFWNATPIVQPSGAAQAALGTATTVGANVGTAAAGLSLIGDTTSVNQAGNIMNDFASIQEDIAALFTLVGAQRTALVNAGIMKGAA